jgi:hypothetical protein
VGRKRQISGEPKGGENPIKRLNFNCMYTILSQSLAQKLLKLWLEVSSLTFNPMTPKLGGVRLNYISNDFYTLVGNTTIIIVFTTAHHWALFWASNSVHLINIFKILPLVRESNNKLQTQQTTSNIHVTLHFNRYVSTERYRRTVASNPTIKKLAYFTNDISKRYI